MTSLRLYPTTTKVVYERVNELSTKASTIIASVATIIKAVAKDTVGSLAVIVTIVCATSTFNKIATSISSEATTYLI